MAKIVLDPVTRVEGHLKIEVTLDSNNKVIDAKAGGNLYRGMENMLVSRPPKDAAVLTQRVCGVCPVPQAVASSKAVESASGFTPNLQALLLRNLIVGANYIDSHILHFYHLSTLDYINGPQMSPWTPTYGQDLRFNATETDSLVQHYLTALAIRRKAHEMGALFGGRLPHAHSIAPGGVTARPTSGQITSFKTYLTDIKSFITNTYKADVNALGTKYSDYYNIGRGYGTLLSYGAFDTNTSGGLLFPAGTVFNGTVNGFNQTKIKENTKYSWYTAPANRYPGAETTTPSVDKAGAYSWLKAPRYNYSPYEVGPIARMWMSGDYTKGVSVMDRHMARCLETEKLATNMLTWVDQIAADSSAYTELAAPASGTGIGLTEAPRGALGHWMSVSNSVISNYQIISPTCWNCSPKDDSDYHGPAEMALIGTTVADPTKPVELLRIIHSYDPCTGCAVHVISSEGEEMSKFVVNPMGA